MPNPLEDPRFSGLIESARALQPRTVALRRHLHRHPETGLRLPNTQAAVLRALDGLPLAVHKGNSCDSVVAVLHGDRPGPTVLLRADMDALPVHEETGYPFASEVDGAMHACGHDTHTAMLASAARLLCTRKSVLSGQVVFMFQPGEEGPGGAERMIEEGVLDSAGVSVDQAFALHITASLKSGVIATKQGPIMAAADAFSVRVIGKGGHAAQPQYALDPIPPAAAMVGALHTMMSRRIDPAEHAVLTVGRIRAGEVDNVIPEIAEIGGTIRTLSEQTRSTLQVEAKRVCEHIAASYGCTTVFQLKPGYSVTVNDPQVVDQVLNLANGILGSKCGLRVDQAAMGAEDFSYVLSKVPGAMAFLGACPPGVEPERAAPNHSPRAQFDESAMEHGVAMYAAFALDTLR